MASDPRVQRLLEEVLDSGHTPEEVCRACPELLSQVRDGLRQLSGIEAEVDALFSEPEPTQVPSKIPSASPAQNLPRIAGYDVREVLGRGGMGVVYKAQHLRLNRPVALKMLLSGAYARTEERERFLREAEAVAGLRHANIVQVHDVGEQDGRQYFTMEFVEGGSLAQKLAGTPQPAQQAAAMLATLADAVHAAHQGAIIHRDLKPANVLLTADGTPKITDFGLAKRLEGGAGLTMSGDAMGTPSYMAPEQAQGKAHAMGTAVDIYALGAILYEMLTGRPPFRAESAAETVQQVITQEPALPSRLNAKVPRDLETICLKCLNKDPQRRYITSAALAEDIHRFQRGETIMARPASATERVSKWVRRRPAQALVLAGSVLLTIGLIGGGLWLLSERRAVALAVEADLREAAQAQQRSSWAVASAALGRARVRLGSGKPDELRRRLEQGEQDLELAARLDDIRSHRTVSIAGDIRFRETGVEYAAAFRDAGMGDFSKDPATVGTRIRASNIRKTLVAALDDWIRGADRKQQEWILEVAFQADPEEKAWRDPLRDREVWNNAATMKQLGETALENKRSVSALVLLGGQLKELSLKDGAAFLMRVQREHPGDFWTNLAAGDVMIDKKSFVEATRYYQAALAIRPNSSVAYNNLGSSLGHSGHREEALDCFRNAARIDPKSVLCQRNVGHALLTLDRHEEAVEQFRRVLLLDAGDDATLYLLGFSLLKLNQNVEAVTHLEHAVNLQPRNAEYRNALGLNLIAIGREADAIGQWQQAFALDPKGAGAFNNLRNTFLKRLRFEEARLVWQKAAEVNPDDQSVWDGYAELCLYMGKEDECRRACQALLDNFGKTREPRAAEQIGRACLFLPAVSDDMLRRATALVDLAVNDEALKTQWPHPYFMFAKGLAEYRHGRMESAAAILQGEASKVLGPAPDLVLAMAQHRLGKEEDARKTLAAAIRKFDWNAAKAINSEAWIYHVLRREAEKLILPNPPALPDRK